jgi:pyruvate,water dikinase
VPAAEQAAFDELLLEARLGYGLRDDHAGVTMWGVGIAREAMLEAGARLTTSGVLTSPSDFAVLSFSDAAALLRGTGGPSADAIASAVAERAAATGVTPPRVLGTVHEPPSPDLFPAPLARVARAVNAYLDMDDADTGDGLQGTGVGERPVTGIARVARDADDALLRIEPGEILVTATTTPAFNTAMAIAAGVVTAYGGSMSHAAIVARELGIPAIVGAFAALERIPDGAKIELDPVAGTVSVLGS